MNFCTKCGTQNAAGITFCTSCGNNVAESQYQQQYQQPQPQYQQPVYQQPAVVDNPGNTLGIVSLILGIASIVFAFGLLGIVGIVLAKSSNTKQTEAGLPTLGTAKGGMITSIIGLVGGILFGLIISLAVFIPLLLADIY